MGRLIGAVTPGNLDENYFLEKAAAYFDDQVVIYRNRRVFGRGFDVCILIPEKGVLVVGLKGWREENILRAEGDALILKTVQGETAAAPQKQAGGYRFAMERYIRQNLGKSPPVFPVVCLPRVSLDFCRARRLDTALEEGHTFFKEDLADKAAFFRKLGQALGEAGRRPREPFDKKTMEEVRGLLEASIEPPAETGDKPKGAVDCHAHDYSRFYYIAEKDNLSDGAAEEMAEAYGRGCKLYGVFSTGAQMQKAAAALEAALDRRGLVRDGDNLRLALHSEERHRPERPAGAAAFTAFHCSFSVASSPLPPDIPSFSLSNGLCGEAQAAWLRRLDRQSAFNAPQYFAEHAPPEKNILIRAGAGTGKTHTMISRVGYICYSQKVPLRQMARRIVMITFTNEAADQMAEKLKTYFRNCYLITGRAAYLDMVSQVDAMQISTIHAFARQLIGKLGAAFGYGAEPGIIAGDYHRRRKVSDMLDAYILQKEKACGGDFTQKLGMPVYAIRESILDFIGKLHSKNLDIGSIRAGDFGPLSPDDPHAALHELLAAVIPAAERACADQLRENNQIHLGSIMSVLNRFMSAPENKARIRGLKEEETARQFLFVDEFQDTDDIQIETLLTLAALLDYRLFLVGDVKQCIYRFRGAKEKAFDRLGIEENPGEWLEYALQKNYRTDRALLQLFENSFASWGNRPEPLLSYRAERDSLIGLRDCNHYLLNQKEKFFRRLSISGDEMRIPALIQEIRRLQRRIGYEEAQGMALSSKEKSIAILVRENWQAEVVRRECGKAGISIQTHTGGDLYCSQPALDMMTLVNALVHFDEAGYLYSLATSNFFHLDIPKSNLLSIREGPGADGFKGQAAALIRLMNLLLANAGSRESRWEYIVASLRTRPVLQVIRQIYNALEPWRNCSGDLWKQRDYQLQVDLLFEQLINACHVDSLTINTLQAYLYNCIVSQVSVDSRRASAEEENPLQCITVHKAKGLAYGHVILPFCSAPLGLLKKSPLHVSVEKRDGRFCIGYSLRIGSTGERVQNGYYDEAAEISEKIREETRILYVAMTRAIRSFSWIEAEGKRDLSWQNLIEGETGHAV